MAVWEYKVETGRGLMGQLEPKPEDILPYLNKLGDGTQPEDYSELFDKPEEETAPTEIKPDPSKKMPKRNRPLLHHILLMNTK